MTDLLSALSCDLLDHECGQACPPDIRCKDVVYIVVYIV